MRKCYLLIAFAFLCSAIFTSCKHSAQHIPVVVTNNTIGEDEENDEYDGPAERDVQEFEKTKDPSLGYVPYTRLPAAIAQTEQSKGNHSYNQRFAVLWQERGPIYDSVGPSGNPRGGGGFTSGRMAAILIDTLNDPTGNTVIVGGISGGVWKCTNFLSTIPNWRIVNDYFANMAISSLCQDPTNPSVIYFSTGEATSNADAHFGAGIWKSTDKGESFTQLPSSVNFIRNWKMLCDPSGNVYLASRTTATPAVNTAGLLRSNDGGATWTNITPTLVGTATVSATCTDIELSSTGRLYASFGYSTGGAATIRPYVTTTPATVTQSTGWILGSGGRVATAGRMELACIADTVYGITANAANNADSCYKSVDGGLTWVKTNTTILPAGLGNGQAWYDLTLSINPANSHELMSGGLDAYRSTNNGATWTRTTFWVTTAPYVHADHHNMQWMIKGGESRIVIGCDGGIFFSRDGGVTWKDKNRNLNLKQFYCAAINPNAGSPYLLAGAQDNGTHAITTPGLTYSSEVLGGDGMYCYINQLDPNIQFGAYVYSNYRRSVDGGRTWTSFPTNNTGQFTNPFDYDDAQNILYGSYSANNLYRLLNANTSTAYTVVPVTALNGGVISGLKVSPYTTNRLFLGSSGGRILRLDNANATPVVTDITGAAFPPGNINCVNTGTDDNHLVATFTNFGVNNVWITSDGGTSWTAIDGNLPDMPVWWAIFDPANNNRLMIATETGIWTTDNINGASTVWYANPGIPTTRISMIRMRSVDRTVVAATYGRGLYTGTFSSSTTPEISFVSSATTVTEQTAATTGCRSYKDYIVNVGIINAPAGDATVTYSVLGGTARQGVDFDISTNGDFSSPSLTHTFTSGNISIQPITVRVYDDAEVEPTEQFTLGFTISGVTNAVPGTVAVHTFTINDNDRYPVPYSVTNYAIGTYNTDLTSLNTPFDGTKLKHRLQVLYTAAELKAAGMTLSASINSSTIRVKTKNTVRAFTGFTVSIANTSNTTLAAGYVPEGLTTVYTSNYNTVVGDNTFNYSTPFVWDGVSNVVIQYCYDMSAYGTPDNLIDIVEGTSAPLGTGVRGSTYSNYTTSGAAGCALAAAFVSDPRATVTFNAAFGDKVATAVNSTKTEYLTSNNDLFYYSASGEVLARVLNLTNQNYGCTQVLIDRAGTGTSQFWNSNPANYLMNKTYQIIPTTNSATGKYEVTFYFTAAEKSGWEAATGKSWDSIQIIKLPSKISNVTPLNAQPDGPGTIQVINAVKRSFGTGYYTLSAIFDNGFSGFGFGVPGRMNTILNLTGAINSNNVDIDLTWTTSAEVNSTVFEVEKSYDNVTFHKIGTVTAAGNKFSPSSYPFTDHENVQNNYYRIKMLHSDGYVLYSNTIYIKKDAPQRIFVLNNPFSTQINVRFGNIPTGPIVFSLYDAGGKLVKRYSTTGGSLLYRINTNDIVSHAIYVLKINDAGKQIFSARVMKQ